MLKMILKDSTLFLFFRDIDVIEWHEFLTPQLKLSQLFKAKPQGDVSYRLLSYLTPLYNVFSKIHFHLQVSHVLHINLSDFT